MMGLLQPAELRGAQTRQATRRAALDRAYADAQRLGGIRDGQVLQMAQHDDRALPRR